jgi:hypothetical protein
MKTADSEVGCYKMKTADSEVGRYKMKTADSEVGCYKMKTADSEVGRYKMKTADSEVNGVRDFVGVRGGFLNTILILRDRGWCALLLVWSQRSHPKSTPGRRSPSQVTTGRSWGIG